MVYPLAKLSISIPDELKDQLEARAESEKVAVSHVVTEALRSFFALPQQGAPEEPVSPTPSPGSSEEIRQLQEYLWDFYLSYERTRASVLALHSWGERSGEMLLGIPPDSNSFKKPPWPKPRPRPSK